MESKLVFRIGSRSGLLAALFTISYVIIQLWQVYGTLRYPWDEILIYGSSLCIVIPFMLALHPLIAFVYFYPFYTERLLLLGFPWGITAPLAMMALALSFREHLTQEKPGTSNPFKPQNITSLLN